MWHVETDYVALAIFLAMLFKAVRVRDEGDAQQRMFLVLLGVGSISAAVDIASSSAMNCPLSWWYYQIAMTLYCAMIPVLSAAWVCYAAILLYGRQPRRVRAWFIGVLTPLMLYVLLALSNPLTSLFFSLSPSMEYRRGVLFIPLGMGLLVACSALGVALAVTGRRRLRRPTDAVVLALVFLIPVAATALQLLNPGWLIAVSSYAVVYVLCDMTMEEERRSAFVAEIRRQNETLAAAVRETKAANSAKTDFFSRMSHDIRTPLNGIIGMTRIAREQPNPPVTADCLQKIDTSSHYLLELVNDVLDMSRIESGEIRLHPEPYPPQEFAQYLDSVFRPLCEARGQTFVCEGRPDSELVPVLDKLRTNQIVFNLLSNAIKYTQQGGRIEYRLGETRLPDGRLEVTVCVSDNGQGMSEEFQRVLFLPFTQEDRVRSLSRTGSGSGLGLAIVKKLVESMGGTVGVQSAPGRGSTFTVRLKVPAVPAETCAHGENAALAAQSRLAGAHALLCEDNLINQEVARSVLEHLGLELELAENGAEGVRLFRMSPVFHYDYILMDLRMPVMDGFEAARAIRALPRPDAARVPILAMTADAFAEDIRRCTAAGMNGHIAKPLDPALVAAALLAQTPPVGRPERPKEAPTHAGN